LQFSDMGSARVALIRVWRTCTPLHALLYSWRWLLQILGWLHMLAKMHTDVHKYFNVTHCTENVTRSCGRVSDVLWFRYSIIIFWQEVFQIFQLELCTHATAEWRWHILEVFRARGRRPGCWVLAAEKITKENKPTSLSTRDDWLTSDCMHTRARPVELIRGKLDKLGKARWSVGSRDTYVKGRGNCTNHLLLLS
jgi:hypothetical protein